tara:strand:- start:1980 stop:2978 length:999 start_codon:yes stop_codon:yes gene_type:complete
MMERLNPDVRLTQTEAANFIGVTRKLLSKWKSDELLMPSHHGRGGRNTATDRRQLKAYLMRDVVAGIFAKTTMKDLKFQGAELREMVEMVQRADEAGLKRAAILTIRTQPGFMRHLWIADMTLPLVDAGDVFPESRSYKTGKSFRSAMKKADRLISEASLFLIVSGLLSQFQKRLEREALIRPQDDDPDGDRAEWVDVPAGIWRVRLVDESKQVFKNDVQRVGTFEIVEGAFTGARLRWWVRLPKGGLTPATKLYKSFKRVTGTPPPRNIASKSLRSWLGGRVLRVEVAYTALDANRNPVADVDRYAKVAELEPPKFPTTFRGRVMTSTTEM